MTAAAPPGVATDQANVAVEGVRVQLRSRDYDLGRMRAFYAPYYHLGTGPVADPDVTVSVVCRGGPVPSRIRDMRAYLDPGSPDSVRLGPGPGDLVHLRPVPDVVVATSRRRREITISGDDPLHVELQARTLVRDQLLGQTEKLHGWVTFHGAAVQRDGVAIAFMGDRDAGKTSSMLACMSTGSWDFASADRVRLRVDAQGVALRGMPARCNLHRIAIETDGFLRPIAEGRTYDHEDKCLVGIDELTALCGVGHVAGGRLGAVVLPDLGSGARGVRVDRADPDLVAKAVAAQRMEGTPADKHAHWLHWFPDASPSLSARTARVLAALGAVVPVVRVRSNYHDYVAAIRDGSLDPAAWLG